MTDTATKALAQTRAAERKTVATPGKTPEERKAAAIAFVRENPVLTLAGGVVAGIFVASLLPRAPIRKLARRGAELSELAGSAALVFGREALERAGATGSDLRERGGEFADRAGEFGEGAARRVGSLSHEAADLIEKLGSVAAARLGKAGRVTADRAGKLLGPAEDAVETTARRITRLASDVAAKLRG